MSYQDFTVLKNSPQVRRAVTPPLSNRGCGLPQDERFKDVTKENSPALCSLWSPNPPGGFGPGYRWVGYHHSLALPPSFGNGTADAWGCLNLCSLDTPSQNPAASPREGYRDPAPKPRPSGIVPGEEETRVNAKCFGPEVVPGSLEREEEGGRGAGGVD